jgi:hypothetical protein
LREYEFHVHYGHNIHSAIYSHTVEIADVSSRVHEFVCVFKIDSRGSVSMKIDFLDANKQRVGTGTQQQQWRTPYRSELAMNVVSAMQQSWARVLNTYSVVSPALKNISAFLIGGNQTGMGQVVFEAPAAPNDDDDEAAQTADAEGSKEEGDDENDYDVRDVIDHLAKPASDNKREGDEEGDEEADEGDDEGDDEDADEGDDEDADEGDDEEADEDGDEEGDENDDDEEGDDEAARRSAKKRKRDVSRVTVRHGRGRPAFKS